MFIYQPRIWINLLLLQGEGSSLVVQEWLPPWVIFLGRRLDILKSETKLCQAKSTSSSFYLSACTVGLLEIRLDSENLCNNCICNCTACQEGWDLEWLLMGALAVLPILTLMVGLRIMLRVPSILCLYYTLVNLKITFSAPQLWSVHQLHLDKLDWSLKMFPWCNKKGADVDQEENTCYWSLEL